MMIGKACAGLSVVVPLHLYHRFGAATFLSVNQVVCPDLSNPPPTSIEVLLLYIDVFSISPVTVFYTIEVQPISMFEVTFGQTLK